MLLPLDAATAVVKMAKSNDLCTEDMFAGSNKLTDQRKMLDEMRGDANVKSTGRVPARNCTPEEWNSDRHRGMKREGVRKARPEWRRKVEGNEWTTSTAVSVGKDQNGRGVVVRRMKKANHGS